MRALSQRFNRTMTRRTALSAPIICQRYLLLLLTCLCLQGYNVNKAYSSDYDDILRQAMTRLPPGSLVAAVIRDPSG